MIALGFCFILLQLVYGQDHCNHVNCGSGVCIHTQNPALPYFCRCPSGTNTILPCPSENPCSRNPCGQGTCEAVPSLLHGYLCRCAGDAISLTSCNMTRSGCFSNPCINGLCIEGVASYFCNCLPTWTGKLCDERIISACSKNPCNPGKCLHLNEPNIPFVCLCPNGQFGLSCRMFGYSPSTARMLTTTSAPTRSPFACNPFDTRACLNGGRCLQTANDYRCLCKAGYTGPFCDMNINECASNPCLHGGVCYDLQASYICYCPDGGFRSQCSPREVSTSTARALFCPCRHGGVCTSDNSQTCACPTGYTGRFCEHVLTMGNCQGIQCTNGGTCFDSAPGAASSPRCLCKSGFTGRFCETEYFQCRSNGRFVDVYHCAQGKYFECIHYQQGASDNAYGTLLSRSCPVSLRFNFDADRCDYAQNVKCTYS